MKEQKSLFWISLGALGVVLGNIGTTPLYAINEIFFAHEGVSTSPENIIGCISLVIWAITLIVTVKYISFVLNADNDGEGGVFALYGQLYRLRKSKSGIALILTVLLLAAGLLFGDGCITPAISVLSAVEGIKFLSPAVNDLVVPITLGILFLLFAVQRQGTSSIGKIFGPIILIWFLSIAYLGAVQIIEAPQILHAFNPISGLTFLYEAPLKIALLVIGGVVLSITGGEALFADMGHFGKKPIRYSWFLIVFPALLLNYLGQGAFLLSGKTILNENIFYSMTPPTMLVPMILLATLSTVIASQSLISGAFSLSSQAVALGLFPRLEVVHTHHQHEGQIYVPFVNWALFLGCSALVLKFETSANLAAAYGLAVTCDMFVTSIAMMSISKWIWQWSPIKAVLVFGGFAFIDLHLVAANTLKFLEGGYIPLSIGAIVFIVMTTWRWGRKATFGAYSGIQTMTIQELIDLKHRERRVFEKNIILMVPKPLRSVEQNTPALMQMVLNRHGLLPRNLIFVEVVHKKIPVVHDSRYDVTVFDRGEYGIVASVAIKFGFMEDPNVEKVLEEMARHHELGIEPDHSQWIVHSSQENVLAGAKMKGWRKIRFRLFQLLRQISRPGHYYYGLGDEVQLSVEIIPVRL